MPAYCAAANCNNSQTTPGITMHELPRNRPAVRRKWIKFIQFKRADFLAAPHHAHLCSEHFSECDFANPMEYRMGFGSKLTRCSGTLSKSCLTGSNWYGWYSLWFSRAKYQFRLRSSSWPFCSDSPEWRSRHMVTWFERHGDAFGTTENAFFPPCIYNLQITVSPTSSFSASFNGNRVKNHPIPWTCPLSLFVFFFELACERIFNKTHSVERNCYRTGIYTVCRRLRASFSPEGKFYWLGQWRG